MIRLAFRNLFQNKARLIISAGGVALALLLILALDAVFTGVENQITAYIEYSRADIWVSQSDVFNLHMASSSMPDSVARKVRHIAGVESASPILYLTANVLAGDNRNLAYIIGLPEEAKFGGPWAIAAGKSLPEEDEAVINRNIAEKSGIQLGGEVEILGKDFTVVGFSEGTASLVNSIAFISMRDFEELRGTSDTVSFVLVKVNPGESPQAVAERIQAQIRDVTAQTTSEFAAQERKVVKDMSTDLITIMNLIGFLIGLAVMALTVYTSTLSRRREYGMLKALGARNSDLYRSVLAQAFLSVILGFLFGLTLTLLLTAVVPFSGTPLRLDVSSSSLLKVGAASLLIAAISAMMPIRQISGLDPAMVFRGR